MPTTRQRAQNTVKYLRLTGGEVAGLRKEKTLNVEVQGAQLYWPPHYVAQYCLRLALENGCTTIRVHQGVHRKREFDVMKLCTISRYLACGALSRPMFKFVPPSMLTRIRAMRFGERVEPQRNWVNVPSSLTPVSSPSAGGQGV